MYRAAARLVLSDTRWHAARHACTSGSTPCWSRHDSKGAVSGLAKLHVEGQCLQASVVVASSGNPDLIGSLAEVWVAVAGSSDFSIWQLVVIDGTRGYVYKVFAPQFGEKIAERVRQGSLPLGQLCDWKGFSMLSSYHAHNQRFVFLPFPRLRVFLGLGAAAMAFGHNFAASGTSGAAVQKLQSGI